MNSISTSDIAKNIDHNLRLAAKFGCSISECVESLETIRSVMIEIEKNDPSWPPKPWWMSKRRWANNVRKSYFKTPSPLPQQEQ